MKKIIIAISLASAMVLLTFINMATAEEGIDIHEMGESGYTIIFNSRLEKITAQDATTAPLNITIRRTGVEKHDVHELPESGLVITFPTKQKTAAVEDIGLTGSGGNIERPLTGTVANRAVSYELPESGIVVVFPVKRTGIFTREAVAARQY